MLFALERMAEKIIATVTLKRGREKSLLNRHPWIFSGAVASVDGAPDPGDLVALLDYRGKFLAQAYYNPHSQIRARILTWEPDVAIDSDFWRSRIDRAVAARHAMAFEPATTAYRLVNAESDGLPGLIVDRYGDYLVIQSLTAGIDKRKDRFVELLADVARPEGIVERSDVAVRSKEKLSQTTGLSWGSAPPEDLIIRENGLQFEVELSKGHKTGFYLDQRENRASVCRPNFVAGKEVLNVFSYTGGFAVYAAAQGAGPITSIDTSADLLTLAEKNVERNAPGRAGDEYILGDAFEVLRYFRDSDRQFDVVILDPPKFAHSQRDLNRAARGYKDLNWLAFRMLRPGGTLATFSCSGRVTADLFQKIVFGASVDAGRDAQIIQLMGQASDHPVLLTYPESAYLKGLLCRVW